MKLFRRFKQWGYPDLDDNIIDEFYSMGVALKTTGIPQPNIFKVCNGERNTAGGYKWRYKDDQD